MRIVAVSAAVLLTAALAGCSSSPNGPGSASAPAGTGAGSAAAPAADGGSGFATVPDDACSLLSAEEATAAFGGAITTLDGDRSICNYSGDGGAFTVTYNWRGGDQGYSFVLLDGFEPVSGIGDRAAGKGGSLAVQAGQDVFDINAPTAEATPEKVAAVAKAILAKR